MDDFALVAEGKTDFAVISNILRGYFKGQERRPIINEVQPDTRLPEAMQFGSWENIFKYFEDGKHREALQLNHYIVVGIDSDQCHHVKFGVKTQGLEPEEVAYKVSLRIQQSIGKADYDKYGHRFIMAVAVDSRECWLLPLWQSGAAAKSSSNCTTKLNQVITQKGFRPITKSNKSYEVYSELSRGYLKRADLLREGPKNPSLAVFLHELDHRQILLEEED